MCDSIEQSRFQPFTLLKRFRLTRSLECILQLMVEPFDLLPRHISFLGSPLCSRRKLSGSYGSYQEREEGYPVFRIRDGEGMDGRKKKEVEASDAQQRSQDRRFRTPRGGNKQHYQQQSQSDRGRINVTA
jgi:hypothetical protein